MKRKLFSILLVVMMTLALGTNAFAAPATYSITVDDSTTGYTYGAYQIFTGDLSTDAAGKKVLSNIKWGANISDAGKTALGDAATYAKGLENLTGTTAEAKADEIAKYITGTAAASATAPNADGKYVLSGLAAGYYLVRNDAVPTTGAYTDYILQVVDDVNVKTKADIPTVDKKIVEGENKVTDSAASIGDTVDYEITGTMPSTIDTYNTYFYKFSDTLSKGLTYNNNVKVTVNGVDVTKYFYKNAAKVGDDTALTVSIADIKALANVTGVGAITKDTKVVVTYSATLNEKANVGSANPNDVVLDYSNNPNQSGDGTTTTTPPENPSEEPKTENPTGETPKSTVNVYTTSLTIHKTDENGNALAGAKFQITGKSVNTVIVDGTEYVESATGTYYKLTDGSYTTTVPTDDTSKSYESTTVKYALQKVNPSVIKTTTDVKAEAFVDENGNLTFTGLGEGEYTIHETVTPAGYNTLAEDLVVTISFDKDKKVFSAATKNDTDEKQIVTVIKNEDGSAAKAPASTFETTIVNESGTKLPSTGGIGTTIFYIVGAALIIGAGVLLITKRRMSTRG